MYTKQMIRADSKRALEAYKDRKNKKEDRDFKELFNRRPNFMPTLLIAATLLASPAIYI